MFYELSLAYSFMPKWHVSEGLFSFVLCLRHMSEDTSDSVWCTK